MTTDINAAYPFETEKRVADAVAMQSFMDNEKDGRDPFYVVDLEPVVARYQAWRTSLPCVEPHYAVKCNPNPVLLKVLNYLGAGFDCASSEEMDLVMGMGVSADRIIFANPCKMASHIFHARRLGVKRMTFDNEDELVKIAQIYPGAELVLRIVTDDSHSMCRFSSKFGAQMSSVPHLLHTAASLHMLIIGVSYHVGSGCSDASSHSAAATDALAVFRLGRQYGFDMNLLDIGGGFLGEENALPSLDDIALHLLPVLSQFPPGTSFISEPGRYFASHSHTLVVNIHSRRVITDDQGQVAQALYYINDGVYHGFNCIFFDHQRPTPRTMLLPGSEELAQRPLVPSTVFGPTCDSLDCVCKDVPMPLLEIGEWLFFTDMGAYTTAAMTRFNGFRGAVDCTYRWGDICLDASLLETVDSVAMTIMNAESVTPAGNCNGIPVTPSESPSMMIDVIGTDL